MNPAEKNNLREKFSVWESKLSEEQKSEMETIVSSKLDKAQAMLNAAVMEVQYKLAEAERQIEREFGKDESTELWISRMRQFVSSQILTGEHRRKHNQLREVQVDIFLLESGTPVTFRDELIR